MVPARTEPSPDASLSIRIGGVLFAGKRLGLVLAAGLAAGAFAACQGPDPYYRNRPDGGSNLGFAGGPGAAGSMFAPTAGVGGSSTGVAGSGSAGASGAAGNSGSAGASGGAGNIGSAGGAGNIGSAGSTMSCTTCMVKVQYTCRSSDTGQASFVLDVTNEASASFTLSSLTLRYWYTVDASQAANQELDCDFAKLGCTNIVTSADTSPGPKFVPVMPPKPLAAPTANEYAEIAFKAGALSLDPFLDTGEIQLRLHNKDFSPIKQDDDYSYDQTSCKDMQAIEAPKITAYLDGILVWGTEPQP
jgi:hypothetical protein